MRVRASKNAWSSLTKIVPPQQTQPKEEMKDIEEEVRLQQQRQAYDDLGVDEESAAAAADMQNLADLESAKPRAQRTEAEQARIFNLMAQRRQMDLAFTNSLQRLSVELPNMRETFLQRGFLDIVLQFKAAGLDPARLTVSRIDTSQLTDTYQGIAMRGGPITLWFAQDKTPLDITLTLVVAKVPHHGWVFVQDPKLNVPAAQGPVEPPPGK